MLSWPVLIDRGFNPINYSRFDRYTHYHVFRELFSQILIGDDSKEDTPVPIPNTEVKLFYGENSLIAKIASCQFFLCLKGLDYKYYQALFYNER